MTTTKPVQPDAAEDAVVDDNAEWSAGYDLGFRNAVKSMRDLVETMTQAVDDGFGSAGSSEIYVASSSTNARLAYVLLRLSEEIGDDARVHGGADLRDWSYQRNAMEAADTFILVLPCDPDPKLQFAWAIGAGKRTAVLHHPDGGVDLGPHRPNIVTDSLDDLVEWVMDR